METIIDKLKSKAKDNPGNPLFQQAIAHLSDLQHSRTPTTKNESWDVVQRDFRLLEAEGLWERSEENFKLLNELRSSTGVDRSYRETHPGSDKISIVIPRPPVNVPTLPSVDATALPLELASMLNHTYLLRLLVTDPTKVLPPGKSLLSVLSRPHSDNIRADGSVPTLHNKVEDMVHKAFWDEAVESLSQPEPSVQLPRLKHLYKDLATELAPLLPISHPVLVTFSSELSPTISPLHSAIIHFREMLTSLRQRCAPVRDSYIDNLLTQLADPPTTLAALAMFVVDTVKSTLDLAETMKDDLSQFVLGNMDETQLRLVVAKQARIQERHDLLMIWRPDAIRRSWSAWIDELQSHYVGANNSLHDKCILRLVQALGSTSPVMCNLPTKSISASSGEQATEETPTDPPNTLPPPFFFSAPSLLYIQNFLQALVIAAALRSLTRLPTASNSQSSSSTEGTDFMRRIWTLLTAEISEDPNEHGPDQTTTKIVNLADEVVRARNSAALSEAGTTRSSLGVVIDAAEEARLRAAVERTLQPSDPVFVLLQKRLLGALAERLVQPWKSPREATLFPERMQTGREGERAGKRPRLMLDLEDLGLSERQAQEERRLIVKGFEDVVLVGAVGEALEKIRDCIWWVEETWGDLFEDVSGSTIK